MIYQIQSNDPNNYGELTFEPIIPWNTERVEYRITGVNTYSNFLITTSDDFIEFSINETCLTTQFQDRVNYEIEDLARILTELFTTCDVTVELDASGVLLFKAPIESAKQSASQASRSERAEFQIVRASHRVKMLLGLYDTELPLTSSNSVIKASSAPLVSFGNVLYLQSLQGSNIGTRVDKNYYSAPIIYPLNTFMKSGLPIISNKKQDKVTVNIDAAKCIKIRLVDFKFEPVILRNPLFVSIKIKPA